MRSDAEIAESAVMGFAAIKAELDALKQGESVLICGRRRFDEAPSESAKVVTRHCEKIGLKVQ